MIKYFINRKINKSITGIITKDDINIFIDGNKIKADDYIIIECDRCGKEEKAVFKRRNKYFNNEILCIKCLKKQNNMIKYGVEWPTQSRQIREKAEQTNLKKYGTKVPNAFGCEEFNQNIKEKYGVDNVNQLKKVRDKIKQTSEERYGGLGRASSIIRSKIETTKLNRYGNKNYTNRKKHNKTIKEKYGVDNISQLKQTQKIIEQNNLQKYGVRNTTQLKEVQEKMKQTMVENWGVNHPSKHTDIIKKRQQTFRENYGVASIARLKKSKETMLKRYGSEIKNSCKWFELKEQKLQGTFELRVAEFLMENNIRFITHNNIDKIKYLNKDNIVCEYNPDFYLPDYDLYLEPHAKYYWDEEFEWKMKEVEKQVNIIYFNESQNIEKVLLCL